MQFPRAGRRNRAGQRHTRRRARAGNGIRGTRGGRRSQRHRRWFAHSLLRCGNGNGWTHSMGFTPFVCFSPLHFAAYATTLFVSLSVLHFLPEEALFCHHFLPPAGMRAWVKHTLPKCGGGTHVRIGGAKRRRATSCALFSTALTPHAPFLLLCARFRLLFGFSLLAISLPTFCSTFFLFQGPRHHFCTLRTRIIGLGRAWPAEVQLHGLGNRRQLPTPTPGFLLPLSASSSPHGDDFSRLLHTIPIHL